MSYQQFELIICLALAALRVFAEKFLANTVSNVLVNTACFTTSRGRSTKNW